MKIIVNNKTFNHVASYTLTQKFNAIADIFELTVNKPLFDYLLEYPQCEIRSDTDELLLTGTILAPDIKVSTAPQSITLKGYSTCGVIEDCTIPLSLYPLQFDNLSLKQIVDKLLKPFAVEYTTQGDISADFNKKYTKTSAEPGVTIKQYLNNLASQRNIHLTSNEHGQLVFMRFNAMQTTPSVFYREGHPGLKSIDLKINSQAMHSDITVMKQATRRNPDAAQSTIENPYVTVFRPIIRVVNSGDIFDIKSAARNALSAELAAIKIILDVTRYEKPGNIISLEAPSIELNRATELFVEEAVVKSTTKNDEQITLTCVVPDVYTATEKVKNIFL